jgi:excisionase family DNA binding protein
MPERAKLPEHPQFVSRVRAAERLDCSVQLIDKFIRVGQLRAYRLGRKVVLRETDLLAMVEANEIR